MTTYTKTHFKVQCMRMVYTISSLFYLKSDDYNNYMLVIEMIADSIGNPYFLYLLSGLTLMIFVKCCKYKTIKIDRV